MPEQQQTALGILGKKNFVFTVEWIVDAYTVVSELGGTLGDFLEGLREIGSAEIINIKLQEH